MFLRVLLCCLAVQIWLFTEVGAEVPSKNDTINFRPNIKPELQILRAPGEINIDADLNDPGWRGVAKATNFSETFPRERAKPPIDIETWVAYDASNLYLAFIIKDDPNRIRASMRDRDEIWQDDYVGILLDTDGDAASAFFIFSNPLGVQGDTRFSSSGGEDDSYDIIYHSEGKITEDGYQVEMAIPFRSLRFPDSEVQNWRATFWITHPRDSRRTYSWAAMDRDQPCFLCDYGTLNGIRGVRPGKKIEFLPSVVGLQTGSLNDDENPTLGFDNKKADGDFGLGIKYNLNSNLISDLTLNPDFSQVEADVAQVDVNTTFALFFPERRPFFQEGSDLFDTWVDQVYTRTVNNPLAAGKLTGRFNNTSVAYIGGVDESSPITLPFEEQSAFLNTDLKSTTNIFRIKHSLASDSYIGTLMTDRRLEGGGAGTTIGVDGLFRLSKSLHFEWQLVTSHTDEPSDTTLTNDIVSDIDSTFLRFDDNKHTAAFDGENYWGRAAYASLERNTRFWSFDVDYWEYSPTFRADNGFVTSNNSRRGSLWTGINLWTENAKLVDRISPSINVARIWNFDGLRKDEWIQPQLNLSLKAQTNVWVSYLWSQERFAGRDFSGDDILRRFMMEVNSNFSDPLKLGFFFSRGRSIRRDFDEPELGEGTNFKVWGTIKPTQRLVIQPEFNFSQLQPVDGGEDFFNGFILRSRFNYQFTRQLFLRLVVQYNDFASRLEIDPLLTFRLNAFSAFFVGSTIDYRNSFEDVTTSGYELTSRQYFLKFQYLYQL